MLRIVNRFLVASTVFALAAGSSTHAAVGGQPVGGLMQLALPEGKTLDEVTPVTFGVAFRPGDLPRGKTITARLAGAEVPVQLDAKRHFPDGSVKHGVVSLLVSATPTPRWFAPIAGNTTTIRKVMRSCMICRTIRTNNVTSPPTAPTSLGGQDQDTLFAFCSNKIWKRKIQHHAMGAFAPWTKVSSTKL